MVVQLPERCQLREMYSRLHPAEAYLSLNEMHGRKGNSYIYIYIYITRCIYNEMYIYINEMYSREGNGQLDRCERDAVRASSGGERRGYAAYIRYIYIYGTLYIYLYIAYRYAIYYLRIYTTSNNMRLYII
jgi:hypothetical protein